MGSPMNFVDYFNYKINFVKRVTFNTHTGRTSGEGTYLFADDLPVGMATPADCEGIKMEFKYGIAPSSVAGNGKMVHGLDIKMIMDQDWDFDLKPYNATVRGARIQAYSQKDISGRLMGAYINAQAQGTYEIEGYISGATGPGIIGIEARTELATSAQITTPNVVGVLIFHRNKQDADVITGGYRGLQVEVPLMGTGASIAGTTYGIYVGNDWGGTDYFDCGLYIKDSMATTGIQIGDCTTGITLDGTMTTGLSIAAGCTTGITSLAPITVGVSGTGYDVKFWGDHGTGYMLWDESVERLEVYNIFGAVGDCATYQYCSYFGTTLNAAITTGKYVSGAKVALEGASAIDSGGSYYGLWVDIQGSGTNNGTLYCARFSQQVGAHIPTAFIQFQSADPVTYLFAIAGALGAPWDDGGTDCTTSGATDPSGAIAIQDPTGSKAYIRCWTAA